MSSFWVGGYGADMKGTAAGIGLLTSRDDGSLEYVGVVAKCPSPSFLTLRGDRLYAALEGTAEVQSFRVMPGSDGEKAPAPALISTGRAPSGGQWPCQLAVDSHLVVAANYLGGSFGVIALTGEGDVDRLVRVVAGEGSGPHPDQAGPRAHSSIFVDEATLLCLDLGSDEIAIHRVEADRLVRTASVPLPPGTGPRDIVRHPVSGALYVLGELSGDLLVFDWVDGMLRLTASTPLPGRQSGDQAAAIAFGDEHAYVGLRGGHRISVLATGAAGSAGHAADPVGWIDSAGDWPRNLVVDGRLLHVANERSNAVASFSLGDDGMPTLIGDPTPVPSPTYLLQTA